MCCVRVASNLYALKPLQNSLKNTPGGNFEIEKRGRRHCTNERLLNNRQA